MSIFVACRVKTFILNKSKRNDAFDYMIGNNVMSRNRKSIVRDIALKTILNDIIASNKNCTLTTKQMRVVLRREYATSMQHARNNAWVFTNDECDIVRARFDATYRAKIERANKRASRKNVATSNVETNDA